MAAEMAHSSGGGTSLTKLGGGLAVAGTIIGTFIFVFSCFGFGAAFTLSLIPTILGAAGLVLGIVGGVTQPHAPGVEDTHVLATIVLSLAVLCGGLIEVAIWRGIPIFAGQSGM